MMKAFLLIVIAIGLLPATNLSSYLYPAPEPARQNASPQLEQSPRLRRLKADLTSGNRSALSRFWDSMATEPAPLLERLSNDAEGILVTFIWRAAPGTTGVKVAGREMARLLDTDLWFVSVTLDPSVPIFYSFFPIVAGEADRQFADPLNPHRFFIPANVQAVVPPDLKAELSLWHQRSILRFRDDPSAHWAEPQPGAPKGRLEMFTLEDRGAARSRRVWVYTPPNYDVKSKEPLKLLLCFVGLDYLGEISLPTILDNLIAADRISPLIAVMVDNGDARASAADLDNHAVFADYVAKEMIPWIRRSWRVSQNPGEAIVCGSSRGGLGAAYAAWKHSELFGNVLSQSGAFWRGDEGAADEPEWLTNQFKNSPKLNIRFYIEVGAEETGRTPSGSIFIEANQRLRQVLAAKGYDIRYVEVPGARHDPIHWRTQLADGLIYLAGKGSQMRKQ